MNLEKSIIELRQRGGWEAVDLGFRIARRWYLKLVLLWLIPVIPLAIIAGLCLSDRLGLVVLVVWLIKPLADRAPLFFISRAIFSDELSTKTIIKQLLKIWRLDWFLWLTWRRLSVSRSFDMSVTLLEGLVGKQRSQRLNVLHRSGSGVALALTFICSLFEMVLLIGFYLLINLLIPESANVDLFNNFQHGSEWFFLFGAVTIIAVMALVAPFYLCAGFALYINRRIELEAWDIELRFRQMAVNAENKKQHAFLQLAIVCVAVLSLSLSNDTLAKTAAGNTPNEFSEASSVQSREEVEQLIDEIIASDLFNDTKEVSRWRLRHSDNNFSLSEWFKELFERLFNDESEEETSDSSFNLPNIANFLEFLLWLSLILLILGFIYRYRKYVGLLLAKLPRYKIENEPKTASVLFGLDVSKESLPANVPAEVKQLCNSEEYRRALSLLYRATLATLAHDHKCVFYDSYTEGECLAVTRRSLSTPISQYAQDLTASWQTLAYGHQPPSRDVIEHLNKRWQELFDDE